jgi:hypothetical protein
MEDFEEVTYKGDTLIGIKKPKQGLILPDNKIKV